MGRAAHLGAVKKKIAQSLRDASVPSYVPTMTRAVQYANKRHTSEIPLFPGYVFCSKTAFIGDPRVSAICRKQIAQILRPGDSEHLKAQLQRIARIASDHELIRECIYGSPGDKVRIIGGPLSGLQESFFR